MDFRELRQLQDRLAQEKIIPATAMAVGRGHRIVYEHVSGSVFETGEKAGPLHRFDVASLTKIFTGICFMSLAEEGKIGLHEPVYHLFPGYDATKPIIKDGKTVGECDARKVTWLHVLTHTSGVGWTRERPRPAKPDLAYVLDSVCHPAFVCAPGQHVIYSDLPIILLGMAMERVAGTALDELIGQRIISPLGLGHTSFLRRSRDIPDRTRWTVPTEYDAAFRGKRIWGEVHDEKAYLLDGVAGHAGVFSTASDMCRLAMAFSDCLRSDGILTASSCRRMVHEYIEEGYERRGLIWELSFHGEDAYTDPLSLEAYGHSGFTGCFLWNEPPLDLSIVFLSNDVYNGRENRQLFKYRQELIRTVLKCAG